MYPVLQTLFGVWLVVEGIQWLRKKPLRARMKPAAWWAVILASFVNVGLAPREASALGLLSTSVLLYGLAALAFYWIRVWLARLLFKAPSSN